VGVKNTNLSKQKNDNNHRIKEKANSTNFARQLRKNSTDAEKLIWNNLRNRSLEGVKFRRQQSFGPYIVDFIAAEKKLVIELDGGQHAANKVLDKDRDQYIESEGYRVLRFWNNEVLQNTEGVLERIRQEILKDAPSPRPSPPDGRGS
jgi:very-short-patch-repair endonuclease